MGWTVAVYATVLGASIGTSWYLFAEHRMLMDVSAASTAFTLLFQVMTVGNLMHAETSARKSEGQAREER